MTFYGLLKPLITRLPAEFAHTVSLQCLSYCPALAGPARPTDKSGPCGDGALAIRVFGLNFPSPVGLAAGFDKDGIALEALGRLGFGFVEVGTVTPRPQPGNPKPRLFRLARDRAVINRMGFNNGGVAGLATRLNRYRGRHGSDNGGVIVGANIGANKDSENRLADYGIGLTAVSASADYITINISSPNTPGLRDLQQADTLKDLMADIRAAQTDLNIPRKLPLIVKLAPDLDDENLADIAALAAKGVMDGVILGNTTVTRPDGLSPIAYSEPGGLSGRPLFDLSTNRLAAFYRAARGAIPLVGVGGISGPEEAYAKIRAGASLVQLYSALVFEGPELVKRIATGLAERLKADGFSGIADAVGADHPQSS